MERSSVNLGDAGSTNLTAPVVVKSSCCGGTMHERSVSLDDVNEKLDQVLQLLQTIASSKNATSASAPNDL